MLSSTPVASPIYDPAALLFLGGTDGCVVYYEKLDFKIDEMTTCVSISTGMLCTSKKRHWLIHEINLRKKIIYAELETQN